MLPTFPDDGLPFDLDLIKEQMGVSVCVEILKARGRGAQLHPSEIRTTSGVRSEMEASFTPQHDVLVRLDCGGNLELVQGRPSR